MRFLLLLISLTVVTHADEVKDLQRKLEVRSPIEDFELKGQYTIRDGTGKKGQYELASACYRFIRADGSMNTDIDPMDPNSTMNGMGGELFKAFNRVGSDCFVNNANYSKICPNFYDFLPGKKQQFLMVFFATLAHYESSCDQSARAWCLNDYGVGFWQLEETQAQRFASGRDEQFCMARDPAKMAQPLRSGCVGAKGVKPEDVDINVCAIKFQAECAAATFRDLYCTSNDHTKNTAIGDEVRYWEKLREGRTVFDVIASFPGCRAGQ